jgi:hypothetical protein
MNCRAASIVLHIAFFAGFIYMIVKPVLVAWILLR